MNLVQQYIDHLAAELRQTFPTLTVEQREPAEGELAATEDTRQIFLTTEGIELGEQIADQGLSTVVLVPVMASTVMPRPSNPLDAVRTLRRRLKLFQAVQRSIRTFPPAVDGAALLNIVQEQPNLIEGYYVSIVGIEITFDLATEEAL